MKMLDKKLHDIRKPLNAISMQAELIKMIEESREVDQNIVEAATKIIKHTKQCSALLEDLYSSVEQELSQNQNTVKNNLRR